MGINPQEAIKKLKALIDQVDQPMKKSFQNVHQGFITETLDRFLKARDYDVGKAHKMLVDCLKWRVENEIDKVLRVSVSTAHSLRWPKVFLLTSLYCLQKPIFPADVYRAVRDSQLVGLSGYSKEGLPVFAIGVGLSALDKANVNDYVQSHIQINEYRDRVILPSASKRYGRPITTCVKILDMTGLKLSALGHTKLLTILSTIDDLNYPERTTAYYIVNAPYVFSSCWKVVKPLLHERTRKKVQVLPGCGRDELLKIMDYSSLPHFCKRESSLSSRSSARQGGNNCYSLDHLFHQQLYNYIKQQSLINEPVEPIRKGSFQVNLQVPASKSKGAAKTIETELRKYGNGLSDTLIELEIM
ncbi:SEC14 cytosolic factor-like isoform X1 [Benincasa hispida]|uniref:SEC14 cytosolic factor-like isoform X1 n=1 Tax=Benincasa hispida TaxID=102211 RepID=UPI0019020154|nr:SEC14 cytosolic factor-like isoform X1 [Benincasa hispida]